MKLSKVNQIPAAEAQQLFLKCCGSLSWAKAMIAARPFHDQATLFAQSDKIWERLSEADYLEAFSHHPQIGENPDELRKRFASTSQWASQEQAGVTGAGAELIQSLADANRRYREKFGFIFIICATGKSAAEMLEALEERLGHQRREEIQIAAREQSKITRIRLEKLL